MLRPRFHIRTLMVAVVVVSLWAAAATLATQPATAGLAVWTLFYLVPLTLIVVRRVSVERILRVGTRILALTAPAVALYGLLCFLMSGAVGLVGGSLLGLLLAVCVALLAAGLNRKDRDQATSTGFESSRIFFPD